MEAHVALLTVQAELSACRENTEMYSWVISSIDEVTQSFHVTMISPKDEEIYIINFQFDNYPEVPLLIDFIDPQTSQIGTARAYPKSNDSFFQPNGIICHPCSRKSYKGYSGLHKDWEISNWKGIAGSLTNLLAILDAIYSRISNQHYAGRMAP